MSEKTCPDCLTIGTEDERTGEIYCGECGTVIDSATLSLEPEWRVFVGGNDGVKIRASISESEGPSYTTFHTDRDGNGVKLPQETIATMVKLKHYDAISRAAEALARSVDIAGVEIDRLGYLISVSSMIRSRARELYEMSLQKDLVRGRSIDAFVAAALYLACREYVIPRSLDEIVELSTRGPREVSRTYRLMLRKLDVNPPITDATIFIPKIIGTLNMKQSTEIMAVKILQESSKQMSSSGKDPRSLAAAAVYLAGTLNDDQRTQEKISEVSGVTQVTIRNRMNTLKKVMEKA